MEPKIHKAFRMENLVDGNWYKIGIGIVAPLVTMWVEKSLLGENNFVRLNTEDYQKVKREGDIECWSDKIIGFSKEGVILIDPDKYHFFVVNQDETTKYSADRERGESIITSDVTSGRLYNSLLDKISKTREVKFVN